jgi:hypothetical protein
MNRRIVVPEREVQKLILDYFNAQPRTRLYRRNVGRAKLTGGIYVQFGRRGMSDLWGLSEGRHVEIEVKRIGELPSIHQLSWIDEINDLGGIAFWANSLELAIERFEALKGIRK